MTMLVVQSAMARSDQADHTKDGLMGRIRYSSHNRDDRSKSML